MQIKLALPGGYIVDVPTTGPLLGWQISWFPPDPEPYFEHDGQRYRVVDKQPRHLSFGGQVEIWRLELVEATN